jgi:exosortase/archaeosortase family protein
LTGFAVFAVFIAYIARAAVWKKSAMFAGSFLLVYALNIVRMIVIMLIGAQSGLERALIVRNTVNFSSLTLFSRH